MNSVSQAAFKVALGGLVCSIAGFAHQMVIASSLGAGAKMDAFLTELGLPFHLQAVLRRGASVVFVLAPDLLSQTRCVARELSVICAVAGGVCATIAFRLDRRTAMSLLRIVGVEQVLGGIRLGGQPGAGILLR